MVKTRIKLNDGSVIETDERYYYTYDDKLNDPRIEFLSIGNFNIRKSVIDTIERIEVPDSEEEKK